MIQVYIPTMGRPRKQITLQQLPRELQRDAILVVPQAEVNSYKLVVGPMVKEIVGQPPGVKGIAATRQFIMEHAQQDHLVMLDDDVRFFVKEGTDRSQRRPIIGASPSIKLQMFEWLLTQLSSFAHASFTIRSLNWQSARSYMEGTRMMHVLAYNRRRVLDAGCSFTQGVDETFSMDDFHVTLQLLRKGLLNRVSVDYCTNPSTSNSAGGASQWRTSASHNASALRLAELHPGLVTVKEKKGWQGMGETRLDVIVKWQKALQESRR